MTGKRDMRARAMPPQGYKDESGGAGIEFALIAPIFVLLIAIIFEIGLVIRAKSNLVSAISAAANHTLAVSNTIDGGTAPSVAGMLAGLVAQNGRSVSVNVNNAVTAQSVSGTLTVQNSGSAVTACYCPTRTGDVLAWGGVTGCNTPCTDGSTAGRFVQIAASATFDPLLGQFGLLTAQTIENSALVRLP